MNVQIPETLLVDLYIYFTCGNGMDDDTANTIREEIKKKFDSHVRRMTYTVYKTSNDPDAAERARQQYLNQIGIPDEYRW